MHYICFYILAFAGMSYKWKHTEYNLLILVLSRSVMHLRVIHVYVPIICSCLLLSSIPLCGWTTVYLPIYLLKNKWTVSSFGQLCIMLIHERLLLNHAKTLGFLAPRGEEFNLGPETRLYRSELLCNKVLLKYKGDGESFWHRHQKGAERVPTC